VIAAPRLPRVPKRVAWSVPRFVDRGAAQVAAEEIRATMWSHAGIDRTATGLREAIAELEDITSRLPEGATEEANMTETAMLIATAALQRQESRGGHFRRDFPRPKNKWRGRHIEF
jgi:L-aspartate oxidase